MDDYSDIIDVAINAYEKGKIVRFGTLASYLEDNGIQIYGSNTAARNRGAASKVRAAYNRCSNQYERDAILEVFKGIDFKEAY